MFVQKHNNVYCIENKTIRIGKNLNPKKRSEEAAEKRLKIFLSLITLVKFSLAKPLLVQNSSLKYQISKKRSEDVGKLRSDKARLAINQDHRPILSQREKHKQQKGRQSLIDAYKLFFKSSYVCSYMLHKCCR